MKIWKEWARRVSAVFERDRVVMGNKPVSFKSKVVLQLAISFSFLILSVANIVAESYGMLVLTALGFAANVLFAMVAGSRKDEKTSAYSSIIICSLLFAGFVINGGNDGFACLWVTLLPPLAMLVMDFKMGLCTSVFFQLFLIAVFWTPLNDRLLYQYNEQFCLRFPLFYFVSFMLGLVLTITLRQAEYNEHIHMAELEEMNRKTLQLSRIDPLTKLANRRYSYEELSRRFSGPDTVHCIVMGDIDDFKRVNDLYGHEFGDEVLVAFAQCMAEVLPEEYLKSRWGGEEFLFAANESPDAVYEQVEKLRQAISRHAFTVNSKTIYVTMTFGVAKQMDGEDISRTIDRADKHLYAGKRQNKNCTVME